MESTTRAGITNNPWYSHGAVLQWQPSGASNCRLLDTTPNSPAGRYDSALTLGRTYSDAAAGVHITPIGQGGSGADAYLDVNRDGGFVPGQSSPNGVAHTPHIIREGCDIGRSQCNS